MLNRLRAQSLQLGGVVDVVCAPFAAAEIRVLRTLHHRNIIACYEW
jgi:hypothetical protein